MEKIYIAITAHDPMSRVESTLAVLRAYETLPLDVYVEFFIDHGHKHDLDEFSLIVGSHCHLKQTSFEVAAPDFEGYYLCWAHKKRFSGKVLNKEFDYYMYSENDMLFGNKQFAYWKDYKDKLRPLNLEPGFCRFEHYRDLDIPFDNYKTWNLDRETKSVWGEIGYDCGFILTHSDPNFVGFTSLGNPYAGLMILDQQDAEKYITSASSDPRKSYEIIGKRNWPIADRSSMGLAFEGLLPGQEHRRVVPLVRDGENLEIHPCALVRHLDVKYSKQLYDKANTITVEKMFSYGSC